MGESQGATSERPIPTLSTARLLLRPFETGDLEGLTSFFADPAATRFLPRATVSPRDRAQRMMARVLDHWQRYAYGVWAVADKQDGPFIGYCGLNFVPEADSAEVDYGLAQAYWGRGIATEAARASVEFGFAEIKLDRIIGLAVLDNAASRRVLEQLGMAYVRNVQLWGLDLGWYEVLREGLLDCIERLDAPGSA